MKTYTRRVPSSKTIPWRIDEVIRVRNTRGRIIERWRVLNIEEGKDRDYISFEITAEKSHA
jgi:hypothetical protein